MRPLLPPLLLAVLTDEPAGDVADDEFAPVILVIRYCWYSPFPATPGVGG